MNHHNSDTLISREWYYLMHLRSGGGEGELSTFIALCAWSHCDPGKYQQLMLNLLPNSLRLRIAGLHLSPDC